jgi:hypothetical protein
VGCMQCAGGCCWQRTHTHMHTGSWPPKTLHNVQPTPALTCRPCSAGCLGAPSSVLFRRSAVHPCGRVQLIKQCAPELLVLCVTLQNKAPHTGNERPAGSPTAQHSQASALQTHAHHSLLPQPLHSRPAQSVCQRPAPCAMVPWRSPATTAAATPLQHATGRLYVCKTRLSTQTWRLLQACQQLSLLRTPASLYLCTWHLGQLLHVRRYTHQLLANDSHAPALAYACIACAAGLPHPSIEAS